jgi:hypothetical protein
MKQVLTSEALQEYADRKRAFNSAFAMGPHGPRVTELLGVFCRSRVTTHMDGFPDLSLVLEGRRQVFLLIQDYLELTPEQLVRKYTKPIE